MNESVNRRDALRKLAGVSAAATLGAVAGAGAARGDDYNFANASDGVQVAGGWLTSPRGNKHMPVVTVTRDGDLARIKLVVKHPQGRKHHVEELRLYDANRQLLSTVTLHPEQSRPEATFVLQVPAGTPLLAVGGCNLHGLWFTEFKA
jgi:desulfoferrodoxin (superoxide reductase-like protein)